MGRAFRPGKHQAGTMTNQRNVLIPYFVDVVGPFLAYAVVHWLGAPAVSSPA